MRTFTIDERRNRLARRHFLSASEVPPMTRIIAGLVRLHATDPTTPYLSLWARSPGFVTADLERELYPKRSAVRHLAMQRTPWLVISDDLPIIRSALGELIANSAPLRR